MASAQLHRGPDGLGVWTAPGVALATARLTITGNREHGRQPAVDARGGALVFNGEIYNFRVLESRGAEVSDTKVLARVLADRGADVLSALNGPFALARYEPRTHRLLLARDRVGKKPLYIARTSAGWAFASTLAALRVAAGPLRVRPEAIHEYLVFRSVGGYRSAFLGVEQVPPGSWLELGPRGVVASGRYWRPPPPEAETPSAPEVRELIERAVLDRADGGREVAVFLSGGLDSAIVGTALKRLRPDQPVRFISAGYDVAGPEDERPFALRLGSQLGVGHEQVVIHGERDVPHLLADAARLLEDPIQDPVTLPTLALARAAAAFTRVVLTGDGADELWAGYERFDGAPERLAEYWPRAAIFRPDELGLAEWPASYLDGIEIPPPRGDPLDRILRLELTNRLRNYHLSRIDKLVMGSGVEARCPHLDPRVVEAALGLPARLKRPGGRPKGLLVAAFRDHMPAWILARQKQPFTMPIHRWLTGGLAAFARDLLDAPDAFTAGLVDAPSLFRRLAGPVPVARSAAARLWSLLQLEVWFREVARPLGRPAAGGGSSSLSDVAVGHNGSRPPAIVPPSPDRPQIRLLHAVRR